MKRLGKCPVHTDEIEINVHIGDHQVNTGEHLFKQFTALPLNLTVPLEFVLDTEFMNGLPDKGGQSL